MSGRGIWLKLIGMVLVTVGLLAITPCIIWEVLDLWVISGLGICIGVLSLAAGVSLDRIDRRRRAKRCRPQERRARRRVFLTFLLLGTIVSIASYLAIMSYLGDGGHPPVKALTLWWFTVCGVPLIMILSGLCGAFIQIGGRTPRPGHCPCGYDLTGNTSGVCPECGVEVPALSRRRWRTAVLWGGCGLCGLIVVAFVLSAWWMSELQVPRPYGPALAVSAGTLFVFYDDEWDWIFRAQSLLRSGPSLHMWNHWEASSRFISVPLYSLFAAVLLPTFLIWRFVPKFPRGHCRRCGYNLTGLTEARCPECGAGFG